MTDLYEACERVYQICLRCGAPGIDGVGETKDAWIISPAPEERGIVEYGADPYIVNKHNGDIHVFDFFDFADRDIYYSAKKVEVPKKFMPIYD